MFAVCLGHSFLLTARLVTFFPLCTLVILLAVNIKEEKCSIRDWYCECFYCVRVLVEMHFYFLNLQQCCLIIQPHIKFKSI